MTFYLCFLSERPTTRIAIIPVIFVRERVPKRLRTLPLHIPRDWWYLSKKKQSRKEDKVNEKKKKKSIKTKNYAGSFPKSLPMMNPVPAAKLCKLLDKRNK